MEIKGVIVSSQDCPHRKPLEVYTIIFLYIGRVGCSRGLQVILPKSVCGNMLNMHWVKQL